MTLVYAGLLQPITTNNFAIRLYCLFELLTKRHGLRAEGPDIIAHVLGLVTVG